MQETWVQSLGGEDPLEEEMATHYSILVWKIPWQRSLAGCSPWGFKETDTTERLTHTSIRKKYRFSLFMVVDVLYKVAWNTYSIIDAPRVCVYIYTHTHIHIIEIFFTLSTVFYFLILLKYIWLTTLCVSYRL